jgi:hypothetical protein
MSTPQIPEVRYPRRSSAPSVASSVLRPIRELLLRCLWHLDAVESGAAALWSPELLALYLRLLRTEHLLIKARGFPIAQQLREDRQRLHVEFRTLVIHLLARGDQDMP